MSGRSRTTGKRQIDQLCMGFREVHHAPAAVHSGGYARPVRNEYW
jgi:hypothetical protein